MGTISRPLAGAAGAALLLVLGGCGSSTTSTTTRSSAGGQSSASGQAELRAAHAAEQRAGAQRAAARRAASLPAVTPMERATSGWLAVVRIGGRVAVWQAQRGGATLLRFDQQLVRLALHAGRGEPSGSWRLGNRIEPSEIHHVLAAFNGGFKFVTGVIGFLADGRVAVPLRVGRGSIVTYADGATDIGAWHQGVPQAGRPIASVLQNLQLLVDHGVAATTVGGCVQTCWGSTLGNVTFIARSALGVTGEGQLVWAAGESLSPAGIARALIGAGVQRAVELDINPFWVAGYLYVHGGSGPRAVPVVPGQHGVSGRFLEPYTRDFFTVLAR